MDYRIRSTRAWDDHCKLLKDYPCLTEFGFHLEKEQLTKRITRIRDEKGRLIQQITYDFVDRAYISIDNLEQLNKFINTVGQEIVMDADGMIEIYDTYRE